MSFCDREGILNLIEDLLQFSWPKDITPIKTPFPRITYEEAMEMYGTDKPDLRFDWKVNLWRYLSIMGLHFNSLSVCLQFSNLTKIFLEEEADCKGVIDINKSISLKDFGAYGFVARKGGVSNFYFGGLIFLSLIFNLLWQIKILPPTANIKLEQPKLRQHYNILI